MFSKTFLIKAMNENDSFFYSNHSTFHKGDSGLDVFIVNDQVIGPKETVLIDLGIQCQSRSFDPCIWHWFKNEFYKYHSYILMPRSSIAKTPLMMKNSFGLIDSGYLGSLKIAFYNTSDEPFTLSRGERYAQLVNSNLDPIFMKLVDKHRNTTRGSGGFGSTGQ